jgi:hypothetical protein
MKSPARAVFFDEIGSEMKLIMGSLCAIDFFIKPVNFVFTVLP